MKLVNLAFFFYHEGHEEHEVSENKRLELPAFSLFYLRVLRVLRGEKIKMRIAAMRSMV